MTELRVIPVEGIPEIAAGDDVGALLAAATAFEDGDVVVVAQKAVSKAEGRTARLEEVEPSARAHELAGGEDDEVDALDDLGVRPAGDAEHSRPLVGARGVA